MFLDVSRYLAESTVWRDQAFHRRNRRGIKMQIFTLTAGQSKKAQRQTAGSLSTFESWRHGCIQWRTVSSQHNWGGWPKKTVCNCLMAVCSEPTKLARFAILLLSTWWRATQVFLFAQLQIWSCWNFISKSMASMDIHAVSIVSNYQYIWLIQRRDQKMPLCPYISNVSKLFDIFWHILAMFAPVCCSLICRPSYRSDPWEDVLPWDPLAAASIWTMKKHSKSPRWAGHWAIKTLFKCSMHSGKKTWLVSFNAWDILLEDDLPSEIHGFLFFADFWTYTYRIDKHLHLHIMLHLLHIPPTYIRTISGLSSRYYSKAITLPPSLRGKLLWRCRGGSGRETTHPKSSKDERWWKRSEEFRTSFEGLHYLTILSHLILKDLRLRLQRLWCKGPKWLKGWLLMLQDHHMTMINITRTFVLSQHVCFDISAGRLFHFQRWSAPLSQDFWICSTSCPQFVAYPKTSPPFDKQPWRWASWIY